MFPTPAACRIIVVGMLAASLPPQASSIATQIQPDPAILGRQQREAIRDSLVGTWTVQIGQVRRTLDIQADGVFTMGSERGSYRIEGDTILLRSANREVAYEFVLTDAKLTLSGGDLVRPMEFARVRRFLRSRDWLSGWSLSGVKAKLRRVLVIILIVVLARMILWGLKTFICVLVYSDRGPLKFVYRFHKRRTITIYALALNIAKYVIYLLAIGLVLTELGIDYTVYFASLSVIGLAIGFGSQGLVQDMVTGFFIVFEEQFNVGDMVEIPPHTGIVEDLGLRMTRLRNYQGQRVVIPNRNIAAVGNYTRGAQQVYLDVAVADGADIETAAAAIRRVAEEAARQFHDVILSPPESQGEIRLSTGQCFVRLDLAIWPGQQWIIDQELLPRIQAMMKSRNVEIPGDRIAVFYHPQEPRSVRLGRRKRGAAGNGA